MKKILLVLFSFFFAIQGKAQNEPNDCVNAIVVCGNGTFASNASGSGTIQEVSGCGGFENNSLWIEINSVQGGILGSPIRCATTNPDQAGLSSNVTGKYGSTTLNDATSDLYLSVV